MRWLAHAWTSASRRQRIVLEAVLLLTVIAVATISSVASSPSATPSPSVAPDVTAPTLTQARLTSEAEEGGLLPPTQIISLDGALSQGPAVLPDSVHQLARSSPSARISAGP